MRALREWLAPRTSDAQRSVKKEMPTASNSEEERHDVQADKATSCTWPSTLEPKRGALRLPSPEDTADIVEDSCAHDSAFPSSGGATTTDELRLEALRLRAHERLDRLESEPRVGDPRQPENGQQDFGLSFREMLSTLGINSNGVGCIEANDTWVRIRANLVAAEHATTDAVCFGLQALAVVKDGRVFHYGSDDRPHSLPGLMGARR